jgi:hypothetical protein
MSYFMDDGVVLGGAVAAVHVTAWRYLKRIVVAAAMAWYVEEREHLLV